MWRWCINDFSRGSGCVCVIFISDEDEPSTGTLVQVIPLVICGAIFTLISCLCCLGRSVKKVGSYRETSSKSKQENQSSGNSGQRHSNANRSSGVISSDNSGLVLSFDGSSSSESSGSSSGYSSGDKSLDTIYEIQGTYLWIEKDKKQQQQQQTVIIFLNCVINQFFVSKWTSKDESWMNR